MIVTQLNTVGAIAHRLGANVHQVAYIIHTRCIAPCGRAGNARVFDEPAVERIASELRRIADEKGGAKC
jgi:hypothetical protein